MIFGSLYSTSGGNLYCLTSHTGERLLLECGVTWRKLEKALDYKLDGIVGCCISHSHKDHCFSVDDVMLAGIPIYASPETLVEMGIDLNSGVFPMEPGDIHEALPFTVTAYPMVHDVPNSAFIIHEVGTGEWMLFAIDTSNIIQRWDIPFTVIAIGCSFDGEALERQVHDGEVDPWLGKRLLGSHMEKSRLLEYLSKHCNLSQCRELHLMHLSWSRTRQDQVKDEFESDLLIDTKIGGKYD